VTVEVDPSWGDLPSARLVVAVGMGIGGPGALETIRPAVARMGGALAATRKVVDAGWVPRQLQVGLTGQSLAPELAVLLGVRGATNHLVGWKRARSLLAVNGDPNAPVFGYVDAGIVGSWSDVLPDLTDALADRFGRAGRP
jgi:electron transfer flavoprotein alpha subunit